MNPNLQAKIQSADEHYEADFAHERDRETYRLASLIVDELEPESSILALEKLGEDKLKQVLAWLKSAE